MKHDNARDQPANRIDEHPNEGKQSFQKHGLES